MGVAYLGMVSSCRSPRLFDLLLVFVFITNTIIFSLVNAGYYRRYYVLHSTPLYALFAANLISKFETELRANTKTLTVPLAKALIITLVAAASFRSLFTAFRHDIGYESARIVASDLRKVVPTSEQFVGIDPFYSVMSDYPGFIELNAGTLLSIQDKISEEAAWDRIAPTSAVIVPDYPIKPMLAYSTYIKDHHFQLVRCWTAPIIGHVMLYMETIPSGITPSDQCIVLKSYQQRN
jgi:hypothetical protein